MSYSQGSTGSNGMAYNMLNASQSLSSTPRATPPPKGPQMSSFGYPNGLPRSSFGGYDGANDYGSVVSYQDEYKPQIYRVRCLYPHPQSMPLTRLK
jgi:hypothetical protein